MITDGQPPALGRARRPAGTARATLHLRPAEYSVVKDCLRLQADAPRRSRLARVFGFDPLRSEVRPQYRGALGEIAVAAILRELGPNWFVLNAVPLDSDGESVDHVVIGPSGVFSITVQNHSGREVWVGGGVCLVDWQRQECITIAERQADRVATLLSEAVGVPVEVDPCIIVVDPRSLTIAHPPRRVVVLTPRQLRTWLTSHPRSHPRHTVALLGMYAEERSTWHEQAGEVEENHPDLAQFRRLQSEVAAARRRRVVWTTGGIVAAWCAFIVSVGGAAVGIASLLIPR